MTDGGRAAIVAIAQDGHFPAELLFKLNSPLDGELALGSDDLGTALGQHVTVVTELDESLRVHDLFDANYDVHYTLLAWLMWLAYSAGTIQNHHI